MLLFSIFIYMKKERNKIKCYITHIIVSASIVNVVLIIFAFVCELYILHIFNILFISIFAVNVIKLRKVLFKALVKREEYKTKSMYDSLTHALNRGTFMYTLSQEMKRSFRYKLDMSLLFLDLDYFADINNKFGHPVGDKALINTVNKIKEIIRDMDSIARLGGDELAIILPETGIEDATRTAERIRKCISTMIIHENVKFTTSIGVTELYVKDTIEGIYKRGDDALLTAKNSGKNITVVE